MRRVIKLDLPVIETNLWNAQELDSVIIELKNLAMKSATPTELNNYTEKRNFSNLLFQNTGIYIIVNYETNKFYVGKATDLAERLNDHRVLVCFWILTETKSYKKILMF